MNEEMIQKDRFCQILDVREKQHHGLLVQRALRIRPAEITARKIYVSCPDKAYATCKAAYRARACVHALDGLQVQRVLCVRPATTDTQGYVTDDMGVMTLM
jgi:hypothetical protein